jgi:xanthine dehydrogenase YagS FAD-binding subunit
LKQFYHVDAQSFSDAASYLDQYSGKARVIGGGTDLVGELRSHIIEGNTVAPLQPQYLVNLKTIPNADYITESGGILKIGALAKLHSIEMSSSVQNDYPLLAQAAHATATYQIRVMGTIGGNICQDVRCWYYRNKLFTCLRKGGSTCYAQAGNNSRMHSIFGGPAGCYATNQSDMACALMALDANIVTTQNTIPIKSFFINTGPGNVLKADEIVTEVQVPQIAANTKQSYTKWQAIYSHGFGIIKVAAALTMSGTTCTAAKIALGGVAPTPLRATAAETAITGQTVNDANAATAAAAAVANAVPMTMNKYKVVVTQALIKRAILA